MEILSTLEHLTISSFAGQSGSVRLETTSCVKEALQTFSHEKILLCPIGEPNHGADVWGFLDIFDLLSYLLDLWDENQESEKDCIAELGEKFLSRCVTYLTDRSDNESFAAVTADEHVHKIVRLFGLGVHRVAMLDSYGSMAYIISPSDVIKYLCSNLSLFGDTINKTVKELNISSTEDLVVVSSDQSAISAFKVLAANLANAAPIVDKQGAICGTLSVSDLKLVKDDLSSLLQPTSQYKTKTSMNPKIVCTQYTTLGSLIATLANTNAHHVWLVDAQQRPISSISIADVCEYLSRFLSKMD